MSYNRLKSLAANVAAIETAVTVHKQRRKATQEEETGIGAVFGLWRCQGSADYRNANPHARRTGGADKPLAGGFENSCRRERGDYDLLMNSIKASVLTAFYTPDFLIEAVAGQIHTTFRENGLQMRSFLRTERRHRRFPACGYGRHTQLRH